jgi:hypothetical protein
MERNPPAFAYCFETRHVQSYLTAGGRLRDIVGGSASLDFACRADGADLVAHVMKAAGLGEKDLAFVRRAGGRGAGGDKRGSG